MSLEVITNLKSEVENLKKSLEDTKTEAQTQVAQIEKEFGEFKAEAERNVPTAVVGKEEIKDLEKAAANLKLKSLVLGKEVSAFKEFKELSAKVEKTIKPSDISDWTAEKFSNEILEKFEMELRIAGLFDVFTIPDGIQTFTIPQITDNSTAYLIAPAQDAVESSINDGKVQFQTKKLKTLVKLADETNQEAVLTSLLDVVKTDMARSLAVGIENAVISGDTDTGADNINNDPAATDQTRLYAKGLRKYGLLNSVDAGGDAITLADVMSARKAMGALGTDLSNLVLIVHPATFYQLVEIAEFMTIDKIGNRASLLTGTVGFVYGIPVIVSENVPHNLNAEGKVASDGTLTSALLVHKKYFRRAMRNAVGFEQDRNIVAGENLYVAQAYSDFQRVYSDNRTAVNIINLA